MLAAAAEAKMAWYSPSSGRWGPEPGPGPWARRKQTRCLHLVKDEAGTHLKSGRAISSRFEILTDAPAFMSWVDASPEFWRIHASWCGKRESLFLLMSCYSSDVCTSVDTP